MIPSRSPQLLEGVTKSGETEASSRKAMFEIEVSVSSNFSLNMIVSNGGAVGSEDGVKFAPGSSGKGDLVGRL